MQRNREARQTVNLRAVMDAGGAKEEVFVRNISSRGLLIYAPKPPERGSYVELALPHQTVTGRVVWSNERRFGVSTWELLDISGGANGVAGSARRGAARSSSGSPRDRLAPRSREKGRALQFAAVAAFVLGLSCLLAIGAYQTMSASLHKASAGLQPAASPAPAP